MLPVFSLSTFVPSGKARLSYLIMGIVGFSFLWYTYTDSLGKKKGKPVHHIISLYGVQAFSFFIHHVAFHLYTSQSCISQDAYCISQNPALSVGQHHSYCMPGNPR